MQQTNEITALDRAFVSDPWAVYQRLREAGPVQRALLAGGEQVWLVAGHEQPRALLADDRLSTDYFGVRALLPGGAGPYETTMSAHMLNSDPPAHTRLRALWDKAFTEQPVARLQPRIEQIADDLLDRLPPDGPADLIEDYAFPLAVTGIWELLGGPAARRTDRGLARPGGGHRDLRAAGGAGRPPQRLPPLVQGHRGRGAARRGPRV